VQFRDTEIVYDISNDSGQNRARKKNGGNRKRKCVGAEMRKVWNNEIK